jgi:vacuolar-type H+-ATPase subunit H
MESSVKSLIHSEEQAKIIVSQAEKEKNDKLKEAKSKAD